MTTAAATSVGASDVDTRISGYDWSAIASHLDAHGWAVLPNLLTSKDAAALAALYDDDGRFRSHVVMARHGFGRGEYKYFNYPLPDKIASLRGALYPRLVPVANRWNEQMGIAVRYPDTHETFIDRCHCAGQRRPTPLLLQYGQVDFYALHQDVYGDRVFRLQAMVLLSEPGAVFSVG
jgi:hypothetical protein